MICIKFWPHVCILIVVQEKGDVIYMSVAIRIVLGYVFLWVRLKMWICIYLLCPCFKWNMQQWSADFTLYFSLFFSNCFSVCYDWRLLTALLETVLLFYLFLFFCLFLLIVALCVVAPRPMEQRLPSYSAFACQGSCLVGEACLFSLSLSLSLSPSSSSF